jgi:membrane-associated protein
MSITSSIIDPLLHLHGAAAYALVGALAFGEAAIFVGFVLPGETAVILGGVLAYRHSVSLTLMAAVVVAAAIVGDSVGYEVGRRYGQRVLQWRIFVRHQAAIQSGQERLRRYGGRAVFLARFTAFLRAVMPGLAGAARMPYRKFLPWNAAGGLVWGVGYTLVGYLAGASYKTVENYAGKFSEVVLGIVVVGLLAWAIWRRLRERDRPVPDGPASGEPGTEPETEPSAESGQESSNSR